MADAIELSVVESYVASSAPLGWRRRGGLRKVGKVCATSLVVACVLHGVADLIRGKGPLQNKDLSPSEARAMMTSKRTGYLHEISGKVVVGDTYEYTQGSGCPLPMAEVCLHAPSTGNGIGERLGPCVTTSEDGTYNFSNVSMGMEVEVRATFSHDTFAAKDVRPRTRFLSRSNMSSPVRNVDFEVVDKINTTLHVSGGLCEHKLAAGRIVLEVTMPTFCKAYSRTVYIEAGSIELVVPMPVSDFQVKLQHLQHDIYHDPDSSTILSFLKRIGMSTQRGYIFSPRGPLYALHEEAHVVPDTDGELDMRFVFRGALAATLDLARDAGKLCNGTVVVEAGTLNTVTGVVYEEYGKGANTSRCWNVSDRKVSMTDGLSDGGSRLSRFFPICRNCPMDLVASKDHKAANKDNPDGYIFSFSAPVLPGLSRGTNRSISVLEQLVERRPTRRRGDKEGIGRIMGLFEDNGRNWIDRGTQPIGEFYFAVSGYAEVGPLDIIRFSPYTPVFILYDPPGSNSSAEIDTVVNITIQHAIEVPSAWLPLEAGWMPGVVKQDNNSRLLGSKAVVPHLFNLTSEQKLKMKTSSSWSPNSMPGRDQDMVYTYSLDILTWRLKNLTVWNVGDNCQVDGTTATRWAPRINEFEWLPISFFDKLIKDVKNEKPQEKTTVPLTRKTTNEHDTDPDTEKAYMSVVQNTEHLLSMRAARDQHLDEYGRSDEYKGEGTRALGKGTTAGQPPGQMFIQGGSEAIFMRHFQRQWAFSEVKEQTGDARRRNPQWQGVSTKNLPVNRSVAVSLRSVRMAPKDKNAIVGYTLSDDSPGDFLDVKLSNDKEYNTLFFTTVGGATKCPHEINTVALERFKLDLSRNKFLSQDPAKAVEVELKITSRSGKKDVFVVNYHQGSLAQDVIGPGSESWLVQGWQSPRNRGSGLPNVKLLVSSRCDPSIQATAWITVAYDACEKPVQLTPKKDAVFVVAQDFLGRTGEGSPKDVKRGTRCTVFHVGGFEKYVAFRCAGSSPSPLVYSRQNAKIMVCPMSKSAVAAAVLAGDLADADAPATQ